MMEVIDKLVYECAKMDKQLGDRLDGDEDARWGERMWKTWAIETVCGVDDD